METWASTQNRATIIACCPFLSTDCPVFSSTFKGTKHANSPVGPISGMALYPTIITLHCLSWDHQRIGHITAIALYPWALHFTLHVANSQISRSGLEQSD